jgi:hypothetical protein
VRWRVHGYRSSCWRSLQLSRCYFGATNQTIWPNHVVALSGLRGSNSVVGRFGGRPVLGAPPLWVVSSSSVRIRRSKKPLPFGSGSIGHGPVKVRFIPSSTPP